MATETYYAERDQLPGNTSGDTSDISKLKAVIADLQQTVLLGCLERRSLQERLGEKESSQKLHDLHQPVSPHPCLQGG